MLVKSQGGGNLLNIYSLGYIEVPLVFALLIPCSLLLITNNKNNKNYSLNQPSDFLNVCL